MVRCAQDDVFKPCSNAVNLNAVWPVFKVRLLTLSAAVAAMAVAATIDTLNASDGSPH
jgi:hypothetical protein